MITNEYHDALRAEHVRSKGWGQSAPKYAGGDLIGQIALRPYVETILDYGCGKGGLKAFLSKECPRVTVIEYDPGIPGKDTPPDGKYDMVVTCDVLEHIEPQFINETIQKLGALTKFVLYNNIACALDGSAFTHGVYDGQNKHLIVEDPSWWLDKHRRNFAHDPKLSLFEYREVRRRNKHGYRQRTTIMYERVG